MKCEIIQLRHQGLRLRRSEWPQPMLGQLRIVDMAGQYCAFGRTTRIAQLIEMRGQVPVPKVVLADPVMTHVTDDGFLLRGIELRIEGDRTWEHEQVWLVRPSLKRDVLTSEFFSS